MKIQTRNLLLGGAVVLGGALCGWYLLGKSSLVKKSQPISKELIIKILKEQQREYYPVLRFMCGMFKEISPNQQANEMQMIQIRKNVMKQNPKVEERFNAISVKILEKYGINEKEFLDAVKVTFKYDQEVQELNQKIQMVLERTYQGISQEFLKTLPDFLTPERTLQIRAKLLKKEAEKIQQILEVVDKEGKSFWEDLDKALRFAQSANVEIFINEETKEVLDSEGFDAFEEAPERIFDSAISKYLEEDPVFKLKFQELEQERVPFVEELRKRKIQYSS